jgi:antitoxin YefM
MCHRFRVMSCNLHESIAPSRKPDREMRSANYLRSVKVLIPVIINLSELENMMFNHLTIAQAQERLPELSTTLQSSPTVITKDGQPVMIAFSIENFMSFIETADILGDSEFMQQLNLGISQAKRGEYFDLSDIRSELGL